MEAEAVATGRTVNLGSKLGAVNFDYGIELFLEKGTT
jgi:hypothetical protein